MLFTFLLSPYEECGKSQLFDALKKLTEMKSRKECPKMWVAIDKLNAVPKGSKSISERSRKRSKVYGAFLVILGLFALIPGIMAPKELMSVLIAGAVAFLLGIFYLIQPRIDSDKRLHKETERIWSGYRSLDAGKRKKVSFQDTGIWENDRKIVSFEDLLQAVFCRDIILVNWEKSFILLQKKDLQNADAEQLLQFMKTHPTLEIYQLESLA
ncbi:hypothetical protein [Oscillibacter sp.]|uniref:hypothetical protein n=1 Tax=Oscillibacter sp. TaxID=1945593 RepID=UPI0028B0554D|nr:hypothetical protein [Oscillibacter sp.]